ncbi:sterol desaturase family protein [Flavobacterium sp. ANB]|uniref:sterol desaturase family protein n=1 Tax=unclassified Flavobacterium TaxID=196869 RepID=UPI0012B6F975|nr:MULTISPECIES: sterol desaturase family protein [unclassified Flavobacterium]MBF4518989.1 sterol desaturase family protein [Flavobacterium sp. ANB]MTD71591.1 sterol desaturase [Flavobacterium sp. LC2016-13]
MELFFKYQWLLMPLIVFLSFWIRYMFIAGLMYKFLYVWKKGKYLKRKNQLNFPEKEQIKYEFKWSISSALVMGFVGTIVYYFYKNGYTKIYENISDYGWLYFVFSIIIMMFIHDIYFYFVHRLLHTKFMWNVHKIHHSSHNPTPWSSFCMHPVEMLLSGGVVAPMIFIIPAHMSAFVVFTLIIMFNAIYGHCGFEFFGPGFNKSIFLKWINTETFHNMHHSGKHVNYGLYTNIWDRICQTVHKDYDIEYEKVVSRTSVEDPHEEEKTTK